MYSALCLSKQYLCRGGVLGEVLTWLSMALLLLRCRPLTIQVCLAGSRRRLGLVCQMDPMVKMLAWTCVMIMASGASVPRKSLSFGHCKRVFEVGDIHELEEVEHFICDRSLRWGEVCVCHRCGDIMCGFCLAVHIQREVCQARSSPNGTNRPARTQEAGLSSIWRKPRHRDFHAQCHSLYCCVRSGEVGGNRSKGCFLQRPLCSLHSRSQCYRSGNCGSPSGPSGLCAAGGWFFR